VGGVLLMGVPACLGDSAIAAGFRTLSPFAWLMAMAGAVLLLFVGEDRSRSSGSTPPSASTEVPVNAPTAKNPQPRPEGASHSSDPPAR